MSEQLPTRTRVRVGLFGRRGIGILAVVVAVFCAGAPAHAAKPDKPDKVEKPDKKPDRSPSAPRTEPTKKSFRSEKSPNRSGNAGAGSSGSATQGGPAAAPGSYESFQTITERNIFNPNRVARSRETPPEPPRVDTVALVGVLQSEIGVVAFFHSENRFLQQIVREGETIAGLSVMKITPGAVQLMQEGDALTLRVNQQMRRTEGGPWRAVPREAGRGDLARSGEGSSGSTIPPGASEVLRRLMEQRQKQLKQ